MRRIEGGEGTGSRRAASVHVGTVHLRFTPPGVSRETELTFSLNAVYTWEDVAVVHTGVSQVAAPIRATQTSFEGEGWQGKETASVQAQQTLPESEAHEPGSGPEGMKTMAKTPEGMESTWRSDDVVEKGKLPGPRTQRTTRSPQSSGASRSPKRNSASQPSSTRSRSTTRPKQSKQPVRSRRASATTSGPRSESNES